METGLPSVPWSQTLLLEEAKG
jgi:hypothetical protein